MAFPRAAGILFHPTSLPGFGGIGSLGQEAMSFAGMLSDAGIGLWQVLPLGPTGYGDAPYSTLSAFAGNPLLIALEPLVEEGLLAPADLVPLSILPDTHVDFGRVVPEKMAVLRKAFSRFPTTGKRASEFHEFCARNAGWLDDFALFMALKDSFDGRPWYMWPSELRSRDPAALREAREVRAGDLGFHRYVQWLFARQWSALKGRVNGLGIKIIGDMPIFVAHDCCDVWVNQDLFQLDAAGSPLVLAGVPPDYFTPTGQLWGNPHYRWDVMEKNGFDWWIERFRHLFRLVDIVRIDHFRGFAAAWAVAHGETTAIRGEWVPAPGEALFTVLHERLGDVPIIAEDLGFITPDVEALRHAFGFPGMHILQFAFGTDATNASLPHNFSPEMVVYTGTHDNETTVGWYAGIPLLERKRVRDYTGATGIDVAWDLIRLALGSVANQAIVPLQDVLRLGNAARMNSPGNPAGNWSWRFTRGSVTPEHVGGLRFLVNTYGRSSRSPEQELDRE